MATKLILRNGKFICWEYVVVIFGSSQDRQVIYTSDCNKLYYALQHNLCMTIAKWSNNDDGDHDDDDDMRIGSMT